MRVTVFGSARVAEGSVEYEDARRLGSALAQGGHVVVSGGYGGVMEAVSRGARDAGGLVVGITVAPWVTSVVPNAYLSEERSARTLFERLEALVESEALIALPGGAGTLGEVALAWNLRQMVESPAKPVILVGAAWRELVAAFEQHLIIGPHDLAHLQHVETVEEALAAVENEISAEPSAWRG